MTNQSRTIPVLCCGCTKLGAELDKLSKTLSFAPEFSSYSNGDYGSLIESICKREAESTSPSQIEEVTNMLDDILERTSSVRSIAILNELGVGYGFPARVLSHVKDNFPELTIVSILISPAGGTSGLPSINSIITAQAAIELSDYVMIREIDEARSYMSSEYSGGTSTALQMVPLYDLGDVYQCVASDVFVALSSQWGPQEDIADNYLWPFNVCTNRKKLFDVRSSLWRYLQRTSKSKNAFNPMRAMSTSVHSLHLWYTNSYSFGMCVKSARVVEFNIDHTLKRMVTSQSAVPVSDLLSTLQGATPTVSWPSSLGSRPDIDTSVGYLSTTARLTRPAALSNPVTGTGRASRVESSNDSHCAISFESPYAKKVIEKICNDGSGLLRVGAYSHR